MNVKLAVFLNLLGWSSLLVGQPMTPNDSDFSVVNYSDGFQADQGQWPVITTQENYFVVDSGSYFVNHTHPSTPYALLKRTGLPKRTVIQGARVKMGPSESKASSLGLLMFGSTEANSALLFEINGNRRYRVVSLNGGKPAYLTEGPDGWVKHTNAPDVDEWAILEAWSSPRLTRFFLNGAEVHSCYNCGNAGLETGLFLGPQTVARVDSFWIRTTPPTPEEIRITQLERELKEVKTSRDQMKRELELTMDERVSQLNGAIAVLEEQLIETTAEAESLRMEVQTFQELRELLGDVNRDAVMTLAQALRDEMNETAGLRSELEQLQLRIDSLETDRTVWRTELLDALLNSDTIKTNSHVDHR